MKAIDLTHLLKKKRIKISKKKKKKKEEKDLTRVGCRFTQARTRTKVT